MPHANHSDTLKLNLTPFYITSSKAGGRSQIHDDITILGTKANNNSKHKGLQQNQIRATIETAKQHPIHNLSLNF